MEIKLDWKRLLSPKRRELMGLDIGSSAVKMVQLRKDDTQWVVTAAAIVDIDRDGKGNVDDKEINTIRAIHSCLQSSGIQTKLAVCGVCGPEVAVRCFKFPSLPPEEMASAVLLEAEQVCPFNVDNGLIDYQLIGDGQDKDGVEGVLVAATSKLIKRKSELVKQAALSGVLMDVDGLALLNCLSEYERLDNDRAIAVLNIGSSYTNLAIMSNDDFLPFIRDMAYGSDDIAAIIAAEKGLSTDTVSRILSGCEEPGRHQLESGGSLKKACQKLIVDVNGTLRYYVAQEKSVLVEKIFVCGGFALVEGFVELLDSQLSTTAVLWNPFEKMHCEAGRHCEDILRRNGPAMAVAAGLAMRSI